MILYNGIICLVNCINPINLNSLMFLNDFMVRRKSSSATAFSSTRRKMGRRSGTVSKPKTKVQRQKAFKGK